MLPWLREGQKVMVAPLAGRQLRRGDIALFWRNEQEPVLHRVVQPPTADGVVACRGDAEWGPPELVPLAAVAGVVALPLWRRRLFLLIHPARRWVNRLILQWRQRHG
jgi:MYXO-CTERM domain-containing protein